ncbi:MAG TPA: thiamine phosphate synthase [Candidatus Saccharimonadales bacterium]|nr:thiamine phosphate synthase [Candidatus Saccharimonadales bacterium]
MKIPLLYPILDADVLAATSEGGNPMQFVCSHALALADCGCTVMQYRAKRLSAREALSHARELRRLLPGIMLIMNDRADLCLAAGFDGVHVGQDDLSPEGVRRIVGTERIVGLSTHNLAQVTEALTKPVDYLAIGPVFATGSKQNPDPVVGLDGVSEVRKLRDATGRDLPLVAIGGITRDNAASVLKAGADSVAVIGDISRTPRESAREFFRLMM